MKMLSLLDFGGVQPFPNISGSFGRGVCSGGLWERTMDEVLANPAKLKNYPFMLDREHLQLFR